MATPMTQAIKNAPMRVNNPSITIAPPANSANAAAANQAQDGRKSSGATPEIQALNPLPPQAPKIFWAPCANIIAPSVRRTGKVAQVGIVAVMFVAMMKFLECYGLRATLRAHDIGH